MTNHCLAGSNVGVTFATPERGSQAAPAVGPGRGYQWRDNCSEAAAKRRNRGRRDWQTVMLSRHPPQGAGYPNPLTGRQKALLGAFLVRPGPGAIIVAQTRRTPHRGVGYSGGMVVELSVRSNQDTRIPDHDIGPPQLHSRRPSRWCGWASPRASFERLRDRAGDGVTSGTSLPRRCETTGR